MCHYCGCRQIPLIRDYIAEHERVLDLGGDAVRAIDRGAIDTARRCVEAMAAELTSHWQGEENGLFAVMQRDELYSAYIAPLIEEHRELAILLAGLDLSDADDQRRFKVAVVELHEHISKEEDGLFPASLTALSGAEWDAAMEAWQQAHPDQLMIAD
jgi:iron-sulfur cluster repair protein YtfE (RIC family)